MLICAVIVLSIDAAIIVLILAYTRKENCHGK